MRCFNFFNILIPSVHKTLFFLENYQLVECTVHDKYFFHLNVTKDNLSLEACFIEGDEGGGELGSRFMREKKSHFKSHR